MVWIGGYPSGRSNKGSKADCSLYTNPKVRFMGHGPESGCIEDDNTSAYGYTGSCDKPLSVQGAEGKGRLKR